MHEPMTIGAAAQLLDRYRNAVQDGTDAEAHRIYLELLDRLTLGAAAALAGDNPRWPLHGVGSLSHGYQGGECDALGGEDCNNGQCRAPGKHPEGSDWCTPECTALVVWDLRTGGSWRPDALNLVGAEPDELIKMVDLIAVGGMK